jgi:hypothetical protein
MTARKPLVMAAGQIRQIADGDTIDALALPNPAALPRGTAFPASPATGGMFYRTDLGVMCEWDGTRWLGMREWVTFAPWVGASPYSANGYILAYPIVGDTIIYNMACAIVVSAPNNASNYWSISIQGDAATLSGGSINTISLIAGDPYIASFNYAALGALTTSYYFRVVTAKTGSPGSIYIAATASIRRKYT